MIKRYEVTVDYDDREPFRERDDGEWVRYEDYEIERSAMCEVDSNAVLAEVRKIVNMYDKGELPIRFLSGI